MMVPVDGFGAAGIGASSGMDDDGTGGFSSGDESYTREFQYGGGGEHGTKPLSTGQDYYYEDADEEDGGF